MTSKTKQDLIGKNSFLMYDDYKQHFELLETAEDVKQLLFAIFDYHKNRTISDLSPMAKMAFSFIKSTLERDMLKYEAIVNRNRTNGLKGGRPTNKPKKPNGLIDNPKNPSEPKKADSDTDTVKGNKKKVNKNFTPPTLETFKKYCQNELSDYVLDYENIYYGYAENNWYDSHGNEIKNWKTKLRQVWCKNKTPKIYQGGHTDASIAEIAGLIVTGETR